MIQIWSRFLDLGVQKVKSSLQRPGWYSRHPSLINRSIDQPHGVTSPYGEHRGARLSDKSSKRGGSLQPSKASTRPCIYSFARFRSNRTGNERARGSGITINLEHGGSKPEPRHTHTHRANQSQVRPGTVVSLDKARAPIANPNGFQHPPSAGVVFFRDGLNIRGQLFRRRKRKEKKRGSDGLYNAQTYLSFHQSESGRAARLDHAFVLLILADLAILPRIEGKYHILN